MGRRKYTLPANVRAELEAQAEALAMKLIEDGGLHRDDAAEAVASVFGEAAEAAAEMAGAPDALGDLVGGLVERMALNIGEALRPDPDKIMARAVAAMKAGKGKKARRLMARAERLLADPA
jgi:cellobiose-specific phosphotransferase system component IIA